ncbi:MAG TPA: YIP1 family protein [Thermoanaerobaculia bacterium]|jgi:hypothetical protein|nr:YIP1 family protein [Thermoanaerobaculia bacterium]
MHDSAVGRLLGVLVAPGRTFLSIAERPTWVAPLLLLMLLGSSVGYLVAQRMDFEDMVRQRAAQQHQELSPEDLDRGVQIAKKFGPVGALVSGVALLPIAYLLLALVFWTFFRLLGSDLSYPASLSVTLHSLMPNAVSALLTVPLILRLATINAKDAQRGLLLSSLAAFAPESSGPAVKSLLGSVDCFSLWVLILLSLGYRTVARVSAAAATGTVVAFWLLWVAARALLAWRFG